MSEAYRMKYNPNLCVRHYQSYTTGELSYMCKWYGIVSSRDIALSLGRTQDSILNKVKHLKSTGEFEYYKNLERKEIIV